MSVGLDSPNQIENTYNSTTICKSRSYVNRKLITTRLKGLSATTLTNWSTVTCNPCLLVLHPGGGQPDRRLSSLTRTKTTCKHLLHREICPRTKAEATNGTALTTDSQDLMTALGLHPNHVNLSTPMSQYLPQVAESLSTPMTHHRLDTTQVAESRHPLAFRPCQTLMAQRNRLLLIAAMKRLTKI